MIRLALLNLTRNLRRTVLSMGSVIAGVAVLILGQGLIGGLEENIIRAAVDSMSGHILVRPADYPTVGLQHPVDELYAVDPKLEAWLDANAEAWTKRTLFVPRAVHKRDALRVRAIAYDVERDESVFPRDTWRVRGAIPTKATDGVLVSKGVAGLLELEVGGQLVLEARTPAGAINALPVPVAGIFTAGVPLLDKFGIFVPGDLAHDLLRHGEQTSHVVARFRSRNRALSAASELAAVAGTEREVATWYDETRDMLELQKIRRRALNILVFALLGMAATSIANTILMAAYERIREIGTLRAMGMTEGGVVRLFMLEGAMMGVVGSLLGALIGGGVVGYYSSVGIDLSAIMDQAAGGNIPVAAMLYLEFSPAMIGGAMVFGVVVSVGASWYPARVASDMPPAEAVRAE